MSSNKIESSKNKTICTLLKSKSGISSISFSSSESNPVEDDVLDFDLEKKEHCVQDLCNGQDWVETGSPCTSKPTAPIDSDKSISVSNDYLMNASSSICNPSQLSTPHPNLSVKQSRSAMGRLVVRVLPVKYRDYDTQKSMARMDPAPLIKAVSSRAGSADKVYDPSEPNLASGGILDLQTIDTPPSPQDTSSVIALDLYLFRSQYLQDPKNHSHTSHGCNCHQAQQQLIQTLTNSIDLTRNNSSHVGFENTESKSSTLHDNVFHLHMNRSSSETAMRTLRRLEVSTTRKLKEMHPGSRKNKEENLNSVRGDASFCKLISVGDGDEEQRDGLVVDGLNEEEEDMDGYSGCKRYSAIDVSGMNSGEMWYQCSNASSTDNKWNVALALPSFIIPWKRNDVIKNKNNNPSASSSAAPLPSSRLEWIKLDIVSNPPTLLSIQTFENFTAHLFVGVPLVLQTSVLYATHAIITWFVDEEMVLRDSNVYIPTLEDVGKRILVLITPIRPGHNGEGCQEAYSYTSLVEPLPTNPIVELREKWIHRKCEGFPATGLDGGESRLRIVTFNILADLYAGREIDQQFMYSHCDPRHLLRRRRMPMIVSEILSYKADIICLQEVDASIHNSLLSPVLRACGYQGYYSNKVTSQQEGCSLFWSSETFEPASSNDMMAFPLRTLLTQESNSTNTVNASPNHNYHTTQFYDAKSNLWDLELERWESMHGIRNLLESHDEVRKVYKESVGQIVQIAILSPKRCSLDIKKKPKSIVVANTHLFYHPMADHIRVLQAYAISHKLDEVRRGHQRADPVLICGDFNSGPLSGAVRLLTHRSLSPSENDCWKHLNVYKWECGDSEYMLDHGYIGNTPEDLTNGDPLFMEEEFVDAHSDKASLDDSYFSDELDMNEANTASSVCPPTIILPSCFPNLASGCTTIPAFTNYAVDFVETLDYVFASTPSQREMFGFKPLGEAPMPTEEMVKSFIAMPNEVMPSDHVSLVCDFEWAVHQEEV